MRTPVKTEGIPTKVKRHRREKRRMHRIVSLSESSIIPKRLQFQHFHNLPNSLDQRSVQIVSNIFLLFIFQSFIKIIRRNTCLTFVASNLNIAMFVRVQLLKGRLKDKHTRGLFAGKWKRNGRNVNAQEDIETHRKWRYRVENRKISARNVRDKSNVVLSR